MPTASATVVRQGRGAAFPFSFSGGGTAWNLPAVPNDGDVAEAASMRFDAIGGVGEGDFAFARDLDGGLKRNIFTPGNDAQANEAIKSFLQAAAEMAPEYPIVAVEPALDHAKGEIDLGIGFRLRAEAAPVDVTKARGVRVRPWGAAGSR